MVIEIHLYGVRIYEYIEQKDGLNSIGFLVAEYDKMRQVREAKKKKKSRVTSGIKLLYLKSKHLQNVLIT